MKMQLLIEKGLIYVQNLLNAEGKFYSLQDINDKYDVQLNFLETFVFEISSKVDDLKYTTLMFRVYDQELLRSDQVIGQVNLGYDSSEDSEFLHWSRILQNPGSEMVYTHKLIMHD